MKVKQTFNIKQQAYTYLFKGMGLSLFLLLFSCGFDEPKPSTAEEGPTPYEIEHMYSHFMKGHFSEYVNHVASCKGKPRFYREQIINLYKQQLADQERLYGKIDSIRVEGIVKNKENTHANVYVRNFYHNTNSQSILLQMIYTENGWAIK